MPGAIPVATTDPAALLRYIADADAANLSEARTRSPGRPMTPRQFLPSIDTKNLVTYGAVTARVIGNVTTPGRSMTAGSADARKESWIGSITSTDIDDTSANEDLPYDDWITGQVPDDQYSVLYMFGELLFTNDDPRVTALKIKGPNNQVIDYLHFEEAQGFRQGDYPSHIVMKDGVYGLRQKGIANLSVLLNAVGDASLIGYGRSATPSGILLSAPAPTV
jgi:hypothetical protein